MTGVLYALCAILHHNPVFEHHSCVFRRFYNGIVYICIPDLTDEPVEDVYAHDDLTIDKRSASEETLLKNDIVPICRLMWRSCSFHSIRCSSLRWHSAAASYV